MIIIDLQKQSKKEHNIFYEKASTLAITLLNVLTIQIKHIYKHLTWLTKEKPFLLHIPACTWAQSTRQRSGCSINMGGLSSLCERQKRLQKSPRNFCNNSHETKPPNLPVAAAQGIDRQPQFCSADHVNLTERESCSSVNVTWLPPSTTAISKVYFYIPYTHNDNSKNSTRFILKTL